MDDREQKLVQELEVLREELTIQNDELRRTHRALEASRDLYAELYELAPVGYITLDGKGNVLRINTTAESILGVSRRAMEGFPLTTFVAPVDLQKYLALLHRCRKETGPFDAWIRLSVGRGSAKRAFRAHFSTVVVHEAAGFGIRIAFIAAGGLQEEEEEEEEEAIRIVRAAALAELAVVAMSRASFPELAAKAARVAGRVLGAGFTEVLELLPGKRTLMTVAAVGQKVRATRRVSAGDYPYRGVLQSREPVVLANRPADLVTRASHLVEWRISSGVAVPVPADPTRLYGVLGVYSRATRDFNPREIDYLRSIAMTLGAAAGMRWLEEEFRRSERRFRVLVEQSPSGICILRNGRIVYRNPEAARLLGAIPQEFPLREFRDVHPEDAEKFEKLRESLSTKRPEAQEIDLRFYPYGKSSEGIDLRWVQIRTTPIEYAGKHSMLVSMTDITRLKEMEYQFLVREKMASLGHIAAGIAHEIRNPLSGINIYLSALERIWVRSDGLGAESREAAEGVVRQIQSASDRIESVIRKVMDFSRPSAMRTDSTDIRQAIENAIDFTKTQLRRERITLDRSRLSALPNCPVDPPLITQVLINLIVNAAQAMGNSDRAKVIELSSSVDGDRIVVSVSDSGPGIPPALRDRIFDPFFTTRREGYGIGLSFCRRVISEHGGHLTVNAGRLGGAEFRIEIPFGVEDGTGSSAPGSTVGP